MKQKGLLLTMLLLICAGMLKAQTIELQKDEQTAKYKYEEVIQMDSLTSTDIYKKFLDWVSKSAIPNQNKGILKADEKNNEITILISGANAPVYPLRPLMHTEMWYKISGYFKDNRFKIVVSDFQYHYMGGASIVVKIKNEPFETFSEDRQATLVKKANENITISIKNLKDFMFTEVTAKNEDW